MCEATQLRVDVTEVKLLQDKDYATAFYRDLQENTFKTVSWYAQHIDAYNFEAHLLKNMTNNTKFSQKAAQRGEAITS